MHKKPSGSNHVLYEGKYFVSNIKNSTLNIESIFRLHLTNYPNHLKDFLLLYVVLFRKKEFLKPNVKLARIITTSIELLRCFGLLILIIHLYQQKQMRCLIIESGIKVGMWWNWRSYRLSDSVGMTMAVWGDSKLTFRIYWGCQAITKSLVKLVL